MFIIAFKVIVIPKSFYILEFLNMLSVLKLFCVDNRCHSEAGHSSRCCRVADRRNFSDTSKQSAHQSLRQKLYHEFRPMFVVTAVTAKCWDKIWTAGTTSTINVARDSWHVLWVQHVSKPLCCARFSADLFPSLSNENKSCYCYSLSASLFPPGMNSSVWK